MKRRIVVLAAVMAAAVGTSGCESIYRWFVERDRGCDMGAPGCNGLNTARMEPGDRVAAAAPSIDNRTRSEGIGK
jgi:hypothetical protein